MHIEDLTHFQPAATEPAARLRDAIALMKLHRVHHLMVREADQLVGILSTHDFPNAGVPVQHFDHDQFSQITHHVRVDEICSKRVITIDVCDRVEKAIWKMFHKQVHALVVVRDETPVGIVTDTDIFHAFVLQDMTHESPPLVADFMTPCPMVVHCDDRLTDADELMSNRKLRHLPVFQNDGLLMGVLSQSDVRVGRHWMQEHPDDDLSVYSVMGQRIVQVKKYDHLETALRATIAHQVGCVLVVDYDLEGILTRQDLLKAMFDLWNSSATVQTIH